MPSELLDVVLAIVRDRPVRAGRANHHHDAKIQVLYGADGAALAEFCDDHVTASAAGLPTTAPTAAEQHWREWELELVGSQ